MARSHTTLEYWLESVVRKLEGWSERQQQNTRKAKAKEAELGDRVEHLFNNPLNREYLTGDYLEIMRENFRDLSSAFGRSITYALLIVAAFELITRAALDGANLGPFELSDLSLVQKALPILGSYFYYDIGALGRRGGHIGLVYLRILQLQHPDFSKSDLLILISPHRSSMIPQRMFGSSYSGLHARLGRALYSIFSIALPIWLLYAFSELFDRFHMSDITVWIALAMSLLFVILGITVSLTAYEKTDHDSDDMRLPLEARGAELITPPSTHSSRI
jgi:hypothetical protein